MAIDQHADYSISVHQTKYIEKMLDKFVPSHSVNSVKHSKPCSPEAFARLSIAKDDNERERVSKLPYLQIIGSLLYLSTMTRPDISFYVTMLCKYMHDPSLECYDAAVSLLLWVRQRILSACTTMVALPLPKVSELISTTHQVLPQKFAPTSRTTMD